MDSKKIKSEPLLHDLYYKQHNYDGVETLYKKAKILDNTVKKDDVKEWLNKQHTKQVATKKTNKKIFLPIYSEKPYSFQIDLTFFPRYKKQNRQIYVLFTAININTRFAYAYYGKDKEMDTILDMVEKMLKETVINSFTCDEGTEFKNFKFIDFCQYFIFYI
jgi:IS30 family transposase